MATRLLAGLLAPRATSVLHQFPVPRPQLGLGRGHSTRNRCSSTSSSTVARAVPGAVSGAAVRAPRRAPRVPRAAEDALGDVPEGPAGDAARRVPQPDPKLAAASAETAVESLAAFLVAPYTAYARALEERPLLTKACTSFVGFMIGDMIAQGVGAGAAAQLDAARVLRMGLYGLLIDGPVGARWYDFLEANVYPDKPRDTKTVLAKTALDQVVYASIGTLVFFSFVTLLEGRPAAIPSVIGTKFWPTLCANYAIWPLAHLINFRFVAPQWRIAYNNVVAIGWLALLSLITHSKGGSVFSALLTYLHSIGH